MIPRAIPALLLCCPLLFATACGGGAKPGPDGGPDGAVDASDDGGADGADLDDGDAGGGDPAEDGDAGPDGDAGADGDGGGPHITPGCFVPQSDAPILAYGDLFTDATWNDPCVLKEGAGYVMYASSSDGFTEHIVRIYRLVSDDGLSWALSPATPVLSPEPPSEGVETPAVVYFRGQYHLFYTTYPGPNLPDTYSVGHATSPDGIAFTVQTPTRVAATGDINDWNGYLVGEPGPVIVDDSLFVYFTAVGVDASLGAASQVIGLVRSTDGVQFSEPKLALSPDRTLYPRAEGFAGFSTPAAAVVDGRVQLFTDVAFDGVDPDYPEEGWLQVALQRSHSPNGLDDWVQEPEFIHVRSDFAWTGREIRSVYPLLDGDVLRLWFAGDKLYTHLPDGSREWHLENWGMGLSNCQLQP